MSLRAARWIGPLSLAVVSLAACRSFAEFSDAVPEKADASATEPPAPVAPVVPDANDGADGAAPNDAGTIVADAAMSHDAADASTVGFPGCIDLSLDGAPDVAPRVARADAPTPRGGGPIPDGRYELTSVVLYTGADGGTEPVGAPYRAAMLVSNGGAALRTVLSIAPDRIEGQWATYSPNAIMTTTVCPTAGRAFSMYFTVDGAEVTFLAGLLGNRTMASTYTRRP